MATYEQTIALISQVQKNRHYAETQVNDRSTRGHCTTTFFIEGTMPPAAGILEEISGNSKRIDEK